MDEIHIPAGAGDRLLEQMIARSGSDRKITFSVGGRMPFDGIFVTMEDSEHDVHHVRPVVMQDLEHINWVLDDMEQSLNDYLEEYPRSRN